MAREPRTFLEKPYFDFGVLSLPGLIMCEMTLSGNAGPGSAKSWFVAPGGSC